MKIVKWIGHPVILVIVYLLLVIEGDQFGGFFMLYLLLALPHLVLYALVAALGLFFMILAFNLNRDKYLNRITVFYLIGYTSMIVSLVLFFAKGNKWETFELAIPRLSFILFGICSICFLINIFSSLGRPSIRKSLKMI
jgi:hypothetical protein